jgi:hypothetical protein
MNQPVRYDIALATLGGARIATHEYWPPATGYAEHISAKLYATKRLNTQMPSQDHTMTGGPPDRIPTTSTPPKAVQHVTIEKEKPIMPIRLKLRFNSMQHLVAIKERMKLGQTLLVTQVGQAGFIANVGVKDLADFPFREGRESGESRRDGHFR